MHWIYNNNNNNFLSDPNKSLLNLTSLCQNEMKYKAYNEYCSAASRPVNSTAVKL